MGYGIDILNSIRNNASEEYQERIPEATQENFLAVGVAIQQYEPTRNEFSTALIHKIGKTIIEQCLFKNRLARFKAGTATPHDVEEIFVGMVQAEGSYNPAGPNPLGRRETAQDKVIYHRQNRQDYYAISLGDLDFLRVFRSESAFTDYVSKKLNAVYSASDKDEYLCMKNLLATYEGYFDVQVSTISGASPSEACKSFIKTVRKLVYDLTLEPSSKYNSAGVETISNEKNLALFVHSDILAEVDVEVLAKSFNMGKTDIKVEIVPMPNFGTLENTYGILCDSDWFRVYDTLSQMETQRNAQGLFTNYFYHVHQILSCSTFKNAVRFTTDAVTE